MDKAVLFGNGLNRLSKTKLTWENILDYLKSTNYFASGNLPNTLIYDRIILGKTLDNIEFLDVENAMKSSIAEQLEHILPVPMYNDLYELRASNYLTTNYDNVFIQSINSEYEPVISNLSTEDLYSVRRQKLIVDNSGRKTSLWNLHGAIDKPASIMLGLDHYCGYVGKLDSYVKGKYEYIKKQEKVSESSMIEKIQKNNFSGSSWIELFFNVDIHILGFTLEFVEIDIWWIIDRRARMKKYRELDGLINNKIYFYCHEIEQQKKELLESFDVIVDVIPLDSQSETPFADHYATSIQRIRTR